jgi:molybdopterin molybdotransferase
VRGSREVTIFGLPGNPVSGAVTFLEFVRPWLRAAQGDRRPFLPVVDAVMEADLPEGPGRAKLLRVTVGRGPHGFTCRSAGSQSSGALRGMAMAQGLLLRGADQGGAIAGERVRVQLVDPGAFDGETDELW